jgi:molybdenum cofactor synthesis domain-containing protein
MLTGELESLGARTEPPRIIPDEKDEITRVLRELVDEDGVDLIVTTGGTGLAPRDVTPEATREAIDREIPGLAEYMRAEGARQTPFSYISRGIAGIRGHSLIVNVPGSERGAAHSLRLLVPIIPHALETIRGEAHECGKRIGEDDPDS